MLRYCDDRFVQPADRDLPRIGCPGHLAKFDSCRDEALWQWTLEDPQSSVGDTDFEGHLALVIIQVKEQGLLDEGLPTERSVLIQPGSYLVWTGNSGAVTVQVAASEQEAWAAFREVELRHWLWESGCDPQNPQAHEACEDHCLIPEWAATAS